MTNFEKITESPEALGEFLASLPMATGPWDEAFHRTFCDGCQAEDCDGQDCPHKAERNNPLWWLMQEAEVEQDTPPEELPEPLREIKQKYPTVKIYKTSPVSHGLKGNLHYMEVGAAMMFELGKVLWAGERKYRVSESYKVSAAESAALELGAADTVKSVLQAIKIILTTPKGTVPMYRDFGVNMDFLDLPAPGAEQRARMEIREAIEEWRY